jgi:hypothetical protein
MGKYLCCQFDSFMKGAYLVVFGTGNGYEEESCLFLARAVSVISSYVWEKCADARDHYVE